jgi:tetratricopeptide (TPR) repeat protein
MRSISTGLVALFFVAASAVATPLREAAPSLDAAAPDQETLHDLLTPANDDDAEELAEQDAARVARIAELEAEYAAGGSAIKRAGNLYETAKLHQERAQYLRDQAVRAYLVERDRWWIGELLAEPTLKLDAANEALLKAVNVLRDMAANFRDDPRIAEVNWRIGSAMARLGNDHCELYFKQAKQLARTPEWSHKTDLSRADWLASKGKIDDALAIYSQVREASPGELLKAYATYRLGWAHLAKGFKADAKGRGEAFKKAEAAFKLAMLGVKEDEETRFQLRAETARDLAWLWATTGNEAEALAFFEKQGLKELPAIFRERQADEWLRQGKIAKALAYYTARMAADPEAENIPDLHLKLAHAYIAAGDVAGVKRQTEELAKLTSDPENPWLDEHDDDEALLARAKKMQTLLPVTAGFKIFAAAAGEKDEKRKKEMLLATVKQLEEQIRQNPSGEQTLAVRVTLAQALMGLDRDLDALAQLDAIVKMGARAEAQLAGAAFERLNVLVRLDGKQQYPAVPAPGEVKRPLPLPELKQRFAAAAAEYMQIVPKAEIELNLRYQIAQDLFTYGHYDEALARFEALATDFPRSEQAKVSIETILSMNLKRQNWDELIRLSTAFLNNRNVRGKELRDYIKQNLDWAKAQKEGDATVH